MGVVLSGVLKKRRKDLGGKQYEFADTAQIQRSKLSDIETGKQQPTIDELIRIAKVYKFSYSEALRFWLVDKTADTDVHDLLDAEIFKIVEEQPEAPAVRGLLEQLSGDRDVYDAALKLVHELNSSAAVLERTKVSVLSAILSPRKMRASRPSRVLNYNDNEDWSTLGSATTRGKMEKRYLFGARYGEKLLSEIHRIPQRHAGVHRYSDSDSEQAPAPFEIWAVLSGSGTLMVDEDPDKVIVKVHPELCGYYWGGYRHIWINKSRKKPLVILQIFFPYKSDSFGKGAGEGLLIDLDEEHYDVSPDLEETIRSAIG